MAVENYIYQSQGNGALYQRYARADRLPLDGDEDFTAGHCRLNPESRAFNIGIITTYLRLPNGFKQILNNLNMVKCIYLHYTFMYISFF